MPAPGDSPRAAARGAAAAGPRRGLSLLAVEDNEGEVARLATRGHTFLDPPPVVGDLAIRMCFFKDPEGHLLALTEEGPKAA